MSRRRRGLAAVWIVVAGCAGPEDREDNAVAPPSEAIRANLTPLVIRPGTEPTARIIEEPWRTSNAFGKGAARGALVPISVGAALFAYSGGNPVSWVFLALGVAIAPVGAAIGAVAGPIVALPDRTVDGLRAEVESAFVGIEPAPILAAGFAERARTSARLPASIASERPNVELTVLSFGLRGPDLVVDPSLEPFIILRARILASDARVLHEAIWVQAGHALTLKEWAAAGRGAIHAEFARLEDVLSQRAEEDLLELVVIP